MLHRSIDRFSIEIQLAPLNCRQKPTVRPPGNAHSSFDCCSERIWFSANLNANKRHEKPEVWIREIERFLSLGRPNSIQFDHLTPQKIDPLSAIRLKVGFGFHLSRLTLHVNVSSGNLNFGGLCLKPVPEKDRRRSTNPMVFGCSFLHFDQLKFSFE